MGRNRAVFIDRDGTMAPDVQYCRRPEDFKLFPGVAEAIRKLNESRFKVVVITNQSGIGRGYFTEKTLRSIHQKMIEDLKQKGATLDGIYYCPHHPDDNCECRKPKTGLLHKAKQDLDIDFERSYMIGDMALDIQAGKSAGCRTILVTGGNVPVKTTVEPDLTMPNLAVAIDTILETEKKYINDTQKARISCKKVKQANLVTNKPEGYPKISVIICTLNEEKSLPDVLPKIPRWVDEIILVDGNSQDRTVEVAKEIRPEIKIMYQPGRGKGDALIHGIQNSSGDIIVTLDSDNATDPEDLPRFIEPLLNGYDFAKGSRFLKVHPRNKPWHRILGNWIISISFDVLFFARYTDLCSGYNAFWKKKMERLNLRLSDGFQNEPLINIRVRKAGLRVIEVGHLDQGRTKGEVKELSWRQGFKAVKSIVRERFIA